MGDGRPGGKAREVVPDAGRARRLGFDEAILCEHKEASQIRGILEEAGSGPLLLTRLPRRRLDALDATYRDRIDYDASSRTGFFGPVAVPDGPPRLAVVSAGTSDVPPCREAVRTLHYYGAPCLEVYDVGVAGLWRLLERVEELRPLPVVIVAAGMDGALPSVVAGLIPGLVVGLPVSTGYGVADGGRTPLRAMLASCAPGLVVVNIDNGYGAACAALRVLRSARSA